MLNSAAGLSHDKVAVKSPYGVSPNIPSVSISHIGIGLLKSCLYTLNKGTEIEALVEYSVSIKSNFTPTPAFASPLIPTLPTARPIHLLHFALTSAYGLTVTPTEPPIPIVFPIGIKYPVKFTEAVIGNEAFNLPSSFISPP